MKRTFRSASLAVVLLAIFLVIPATGQQVGSSFSGADWPMAGGDWTSSRYSTLDQISTENIDRLGGEWVTRISGGGSSRSTPAVKDGVIYLTAAASVVAIDGATGDARWQWQAEDPTSGRAPSWQGVGLDDEKVYMGLRSVEVGAISQETGELVWATNVGSDPAMAGETVTTAPIVADGKVFVGVANGDSGGQGRIVGLDADSGALLWTFHVIPRPGEFGHDSWPQDSDIWEVGGGGVWLVGTVDPELGLVYFATGNPVPMFGGEIRGGDNLFTAAVLAIDMETGERRWHFQVVRHDIWDADIATPMLLYDVEMDGQLRKGVAAIRADGYLFLFDRETGEPLIPIEQRLVPQDPNQLTADTQPFPVGAERIIPDCSLWRDRVPPPFELSCSFFTPPSIDTPAVVGLGSPIPMVRVTPMSFSPQTGLIYAQGRSHVGFARRFEDPWISDNRPGGHDRLGLPESAGVLAAVDPRTNTVTWKQDLLGGRLATSGPMSTAGGLVFWGSADGQLDAYNAATGDKLWAFQATPAGARMRPGPVATYAIDGKQYIAMPMGNELWAFALDGDVPPRDDAVDNPPDLVRWTGPIPTETDEIQTGSLRENPSWSLGGARSALDEHTFNPQRSRVAAGTRVRFVNNGSVTHTIAARDGSWSTGQIEPGLFAYVSLDTAGVEEFHCTEHPWALGEVTVEP